MKGIILAGGTGSRLFPATLPVSKQLLPVYDKPMVFYPLSVLMIAGIKDILIISTMEELPRFKKLFGNGNDIGLNISYEVQSEPKGIAEAFIIGEEFIGNSPVALILGDNIFYGAELPQKLRNVVKREEGATVFGYYVKDPERYGVVEFEDNYKVVSIVEKPEIPKSNFAVVGLYFYDNKVVDFAKSLKPSKRDELEITDLNNIYLENGNLFCELLGRGVAWLDTGTHEALSDASVFVKAIEERQGLKIACIEEIAFNNGWIDEQSLEKRATLFQNSEYGKYLLDLIKRK